MNIKFAVLKFSKKVYHTSPVIRRGLRPVVRRLLNPKSKKTIPITFYMETSSTCNAECIFCNYPSLIKAGKKTQNISDQIVRTFINRILSENKPVAVSMTPTTGDLLVNPNWHTYMDNLTRISHVEYVEAVTNGILLHETNIDRLLSMPFLNKVLLSISTGGIDRETYKWMYKNDKFDQVSRNVNLLFQRLNDQKSNFFVDIRLRVPDASLINEDIVRKTYNNVGYPYMGWSVLDTFFDTAGQAEGIKKLKMVEGLVPRDNKACSMITNGTLNYHADGTVTTCACAYSQISGDASLMIGTHRDSIDILRKRQNDLKMSWDIENKIPRPCQHCQIYG